MRQAITTKYYGPTNSRGARIKATCQHASQWYNYDHALNVADNHRRVAHFFASQLDWPGEWHGGFDEHENGVWVLGNITSFTVEVR